MAASLDTSIMRMYMLFERLIKNRISSACGVSRMRTSKYFRKKDSVRERVDGNVEKK